MPAKIRHLFLPETLTPFLASGRSPFGKEVKLEIALVHARPHPSPTA
jgi:hypothetical protein